MGSRLLAACIASVAIGCAAPAPAAEDLGATRSAIIDGKPSTPADDAVVLLALADDGAIVPNCTGTLVAKNLVVTARHCVGRYNDDHTVDDGEASDVLVYFGADAPLLAADHGRPAARGKQLVTAATRSLVPDVAFVLLDREVNGPIATLRLGGGASQGEALRAVGFGIGRDDASPRRRLLRDVTVDGVGPATVAHDTLFTGEFAVGEAACSGDSGGPAFSIATGALVGIASRVGNGATRDDGDPSAFCVGSDTTDVYSTLAEVADVVDAAFAAAGATPILEVGAPAAEDAPATDDARAPAPPRASGCSAAPGRAEGGSLAVIAVAIAAISRRRARSSRAR